MQFLVIFLSVPILAVTAALTARDIVQFGAVAQKCGNDFDIEPASIDRANANDPEFGCFIACILQGINLMGPDGTLNVDAAIQKLPDGPSRNNIIEALRSCASQRGQNNCETARNLYVCIREKGVLNMLQG